MGPIGRCDMSVTTNQHYITSQKSEDKIGSGAEAQNHTVYANIGLLFLEVSFCCVICLEFVVLTHNVPGLIVSEKKMVEIM